MKKVLKVILVTLLVLGITACGGNGNGEKEKTSYVDHYKQADGTIKVTAAATQNITSLDFMQGQAGGQTRCMWNMIYDPLIRMDENGNFVAGLATDWTYTEDGKDWDFILREGVKFHNGEVFDANDVAATMQRIIDNKGKFSQISGLWSYLESYEVVSSKEIKLHFNATYGTPFDSFSNMFILEDKAFAELGDKYFVDGYCYGTGKWIYKEYVDGSHITVTLNKDYWDGVGKTNVDEFTLRFLTGGSSIVTGMIAGEIDACSRLGADLMPMFEGVEDIDRGAISTNSILFIGLQCGEESVFNDQKVRKAFSLAIDRQSLADSIMGGGEAVAVWSPKGIGGYSTETIPVCDPEQAKKLLSESTYDGREITIYVNTAVTNGESILLGVVDMVNSIGFNCKIQMVEQAFITDVRKTGKYDAYVVTNSFSSAVAQSITNRFGIPGANHNYNNQEFQDLLAKLDKTVNPEERNNIMTQINKIIFEEAAPEVSLFTMVYNNAVHKGLKGYIFDNFGYYTYKDIYVED